MGSSEDLPLQNGGGGQKKRGRKSFKVVLLWELEVIAILEAGTKGFHCRTVSTSHTRVVLKDETFQVDVIYRFIVLQLYSGYRW